MRRIGSQINIDEMALDESSMELELIKLQANYRHLSDFYESYKEETQRNLKKQKSVDGQMSIARILLLKGYCFLLLLLGGPKSKSVPCYSKSVLNRIKACQ